VGPRGWLLSVAAAGAIALAVVLVVSARDTGEPGPAAGLVPGQIYSTDAGDPIDLLYVLDEPGIGCMTNVSGGIYYGGTSTSCFDLEAVEQGGTYQILFPASAEDPALVVGVMPFGARAATASGVGWATTRAKVRGRWFLASLEPATPDVSNLDDFRVRFEY
jgi:hypothetical protein